jgi:succinylglutamic semialdehyde dehydrogenase
VLNLVQGGRSVGAALVNSEPIDGVLFTGSYGGGRAISQVLAPTPEKILALEMGGNNPLIVHGVGDMEAAAYLTILSAYITAGQRCTCARRLVVVDGHSDRFVERVIATARHLRVGLPADEPEPFLGPVISAAAAEQVGRAQQDLLDRGAEPLLELRPCGRSPALLSPGLLDVTEVVDRPDEEVFGPLLQLIRVRDFDEAIEEANRTAYGLSAGLLCDDGDLYQRFWQRIRAGVVNWNRQMTGASGRLPFGGVGRSGNHRPSGAFAVDCCAYPVASLEADQVTMPAQRLPGVL